MSLLGLDVGTTGCKAIVFSDQGEILSTAYREYEQLFPKPGWAEIDPDQIWACITEVIKETTASSNSPVRAISTSVLGEGFHPVDKQGNPLRRSFTSVDNRSQKQVGQLGEKLSEIEVFAKTGMSLHCSYALSKIMWMRDNEPDLYKETWKFLHYGDYVAAKLGVEPVIDLSVAGRSMMLDVRGKNWNEEILDVAGVDAELLPRAAQAGEVRCR